MSINICIEDNNIIVQTSFIDQYRTKQIPDAKYDRKEKAWVIPLVPMSCEVFVKEFDEELKEFPHERSIIWRTFKSASLTPDKLPFPRSHVFKNQPMKHQWRALDECWGNKSHAFFMRMRTGKTFVSLIWAEELYLRGDIETLIVFAPTPLKSVWEDEISNHMSCEHDYYIVTSSNKGRLIRWWINSTDNLKIIIIGIEAMSAGAASIIINRIVETFPEKMMVVVDESHYIKNMNSKRTDRILEVGRKVKYKAVLSGTPVTQDVIDLYSQFWFLNPAIIGIKSFYSFKNRYCVMGGFKGKKVIGYMNLKELMARLKPKTTVVSTEEAFPNLPERINQVIHVDLTAEQEKLLKSIDTALVAHQGDKFIDIDSVLEKMLRHQQICGGFFPYECGEKRIIDQEGKERTKYTYCTEPVKGNNPKLSALMAIIESGANDQKYIIWAVFTDEIERLIVALSDEYGSLSVAPYYGKMSTNDLTISRRVFQNEASVRFFIGNPVMGGVGIKLSAADVMIYYSNSFKFVDREQSGERWIDSERVKNMLVIDIVAKSKSDRAIHQALARKKDVSDYVAKELGN